MKTSHKSFKMMAKRKKKNTTTKYNQKSWEENYPQVKANNSLDFWLVMLSTVKEGYYSLPSLQRGNSRQKQKNKECIFLSQHCHLLSLLRCVYSLIKAHSTYYQIPGPNQNPPLLPPSKTVWINPRSCILKIYPPDNSELYLCYWPLWLQGKKQI